MSSDENIQPAARDEDDPLAWARDHTPILQSFAEEYGETEPLAGETVAVASHLEQKTGVLVETLRRAGAHGTASRRTSRRGCPKRSGRPVSTTSWSTNRTSYSTTAVN